MSKIPLKQVVGAQPIASNLTAISNISDSSIGLVEKTGAGTMATLTPSTVGRQLMAGDAAAGRAAIGCGTLSTKNKAALESDISGNSYITTGNELVIGQSGDEFGFSKLSIKNRTGANGAIFETSMPLVDFIFKGSPGVANIRLEYRNYACVLADNFNEFQVFFDVDPFGSSYLIAGRNRAQILGQLSLPKGLKIADGATQTASLRGSKTISMPSATDTIVVAGAAIGDIASVSRGKDAYVSAANTVTFHSTGLAGVPVAAIVERFT